MTPPEHAQTIELRLRPDRTRRLEALLVGAGPHLEPVLDVGTATNGDLLVVLPAPAARLPELLEAPGGLTAGEAVTVLVPVAGALDRMHEAGVAHGGVRAAAVVLDADGSPSWTAPVAPALRRSVGPAAFADRVQEDREAFRALCAALLGPTAVPAADDLPALAAGLFAVASPEPVRLDRAPVAVASGTPSRLLPAAPGPAAVPPVDRGSPARRALRRLRAAEVRPRVWIWSGAVLVLLVVAVVLLPSGGGAPAAVPPAADRSRSATASPRSAPGPVAPHTAGPVDAVAALLAERDRCLTAMSPSCLRRVDAVGSPVLDADLRAVAAGTDAARVDRRRLEVTASGGTALAVAGRGTVLAIRDGNEWRLRDVVAEPPQGG